MKIFKNRKRFFYFLLAFFSLNLNAFEKISVNELLAGRLEEDSTLKNALLEFQETQIQSELSLIENGFDIELSSGTMQVLFDSQTSFKINPSVLVNVPFANGLSVSAGTEISVNSNSSENFLMTDTNLSVNFEIFGSTLEKRKITILQNEENVFKAKLNVRNAAIQAENDFYSDLSSILSSVKSIYSAQNDLYSEKLSFEQIVALGYSENSSSYRLSKMKVTSGEHQIESDLRNLVHDVTVFYKTCGYDVQITKEELESDFFAYVPSEIPFDKKNGNEIFAYDKDSFSSIYDASFNHKINELSRKTEKDFSLSADGGFTFSNSMNDGKNTADAGLSASWSGISASAGVGIPVDGSKPSLNMSVGIKPSTFKKKNLEKQSENVSVEQELLEISDAQKEYETALTDYSEKLKNLEWESQSLSESLEMYEENEKLLSEWYSRGIISESELLSAKAELNSYSVDTVLNKINFLTYFNEVRLLFVKDANQTENQNENKTESGGSK